MKKHLNVSVDGSVQGVGFRYYAKQQAQQNNICGWIINRCDGSVYLEIEGEPKDLDHFLRWCHQGPDDSLVEKINIIDSPVENLDGFKIL